MSWDAWLNQRYFIMVCDFVSLYDISWVSSLTFESRYSISYKMHVRPAKTQISQRIRAVWSETSQDTLWVAKVSKCLQAGREDYTSLGVCSDWFQFTLGAHAVVGNTVSRLSCVSRERRSAVLPGEFPVSILHKSIAGRYRPVRVADGPITARCRFIKNASGVEYLPRNPSVYQYYSFTDLLPFMVNLFIYLFSLHIYLTFILLVL